MMTFAVARGDGDLIHLLGKRKIIFGGRKYDAMVFL